MLLHRHQISMMQQEIRILWQGQNHSHSYCCIAENNYTILTHFVYVGKWSVCTATVYFGKLFVCRYFFNNLLLFFYFLRETQPLEL